MSTRGGSLLKRQMGSPKLLLSVLLVVMALMISGCSQTEKEPVSPVPGVESAAPETNGDAAGYASAEDPVVEPDPMVIPKGKKLTVRLLETISSKSATAGQQFDAELSSPVVIDGKTVLPESTPVRGRVVTARSSGRLSKPGYLRLTLVSVQTPEGKWVEIKTTSVSAEGKSHKDRNLALIGGGTGLGAVVGAIAGGGKGAAIGAAAGAGAGTAGAYATGKKDISFAAERKLTFSLVSGAEI